MLNEMDARPAWTPLGRKEMAARLAADIPEGWYVNLGIGIPTDIANHVPMDREVVFHSENGLIGMGPVPPKDKINRWLVNAGKQHVTMRPGGAYTHHADSFALIRGGHLDLCERITLAHLRTGRGAKHRHAPRIDGGDGDEVTRDRCSDRGRQSGGNRYTSRHESRCRSSVRGGGRIRRGED